MGASLQENEDIFDVRFAGISPSCAYDH